MLPNGQFRVVLFPKDYETSVRFYREGLGLPVDHEWDFGKGDRGVVFIAASGMIELLGLAEGQTYVQPQGFGILVQVEDADQQFQLAKARGLNVVQEPTSFPWGQRILRIADPDSVLVSLFTPIKPAE